jgi:CubicO group peptidase (beta-lactamase class C family)
MRRVLLTLLGALVCIIPVSLTAEDLVLARFGDYLEGLRVQAGIPGMAATIVGRADILWERAYGLQDVERSIVTRMDTPMHVDGITEAMTAVLALRCVEEGRLSLDDLVGAYRSNSPDASLTLRQLLTHTSGSPDNPVYNYRPDRLEPFTRVLRSCAIDSFRKGLSNRLEQMAMMDSVPGADAPGLVPPAEGIPTPSQAARYQTVLERLSKAYAVDTAGRPRAVEYSNNILTPWAGLITTVRDLAQFDLALKNGLLLQPETLAASWRVPVNASGQRLPHGIGWFVQIYNGETVVWQFGAGTNGSSSMMVMLPARSLTLILTANSTGLANTFQLPNGDVTTSVFGRLFLTTFVRAAS